MFQRTLAVNQIQERLYCLNSCPEKHTKSSFASTTPSEAIVPSTMWHYVISIALVSSILAAAGPIVTLSAADLSRTEHQNRVQTILLYGPVQAYAAKFRIVAGTQEQVAGTIHYRYRVVFADDIRQRPCELTLSEPPQKLRKMMLEAPAVSYTCSYSPRRNGFAGVQCLGCPEVLSQAELAKDVHEDRVERILESEGIFGYSDLAIVSGVSEAGAGTKYKYNVEFVLDGGLVTCALTALENPRASDPGERRQYLSLCSRVPMSY